MSRDSHRKRRRPIFCERRSHSAAFFAALAPQGRGATGSAGALCVSGRGGCARAAGAAPPHCTGHRRGADGSAFLISGRNQLRLTGNTSHVWRWPLAGVLVARKTYGFGRSRADPGDGVLPSLVLETALRSPPIPRGRHPRWLSSGQALSGTPAATRATAPPPHHGLGARRRGRADGSRRRGQPGDRWRESARRRRGATARGARRAARGVRRRPPPVSRGERALQVLEHSFGPRPGTAAMLPKEWPAAVQSVGDSRNSRCPRVQDTTSLLCVR